MLKVEFALTYFGIPYKTRGKNVKAGWLNIDCPFCGDDSGQHLGIHPDTGWWGCWKSSRHRGSDLVYLIQAVCHASKSDIVAVLGEEQVAEGWQATVEDLLGPKVDKEEVKKKEKLYFPNGIVKLNPKLIGQRKYFNYLEDRGFPADYDFVDRYDLHCGINEGFSNRIVFPVYIENKLVTWVGRSINDKTVPKYKDCSIEQSIIPPKHLLYNYDKITEGGHILYVTEGLFDAIKLDFYLPRSYSATCLFTKIMSERQMYALRKVGKDFDEVRIVLDEDALAEQMGVVAELQPFIPAKLMLVPKGFKDCGEMTAEQIEKFFQI